MTVRKFIYHALGGVAILCFVLMYIYGRTLTKPHDKPPEIIETFKVGDEPHYHRVWKVVTNGKEIWYVEVVGVEQ